MVENRLAGAKGRALLSKAQDIEERCEEIKRLGKNVKELYKLMEEISHIVTLQGEKIDSVCEHVLKAKEYTKEAEKNLIQAKDHQKAARCVRLLIK